mmetsp:Transcript_17608/g.40418  ORF Transcript_17608/g.40418 Transcript_17608/m.40418 type:complete len:423 (+) Transcript_17608:261-1529(+)|eukprot:CAMPEP_0172385584 /NCGR_PEP_ID=MMETSP1061-20121228/3242_1 /TAXON_ID=37318 /ORGANISM="Pseudo-nitzschia pungens, Strain cf. pungens" /LENGTH=422 /DNA_ID=CAMNT_0013114667 /DNA_START=243 /DNA_END=1511 /DNA_ORIENTATION=-
MRGLSLFQLVGRYRHLVVTLLAASSPRKPKPTTKPPLKLFTYKRRLPPLENAISSVQREQKEHSYSKSINVVYTNDVDVAFRWVERNLWSDSNTRLSNSPKVLGLDVESSPRLPWREDKYRADTYFGPATIQLSTVSEALVLQIAQDGHGPIYDQTGLPDFIHDVLSDDTILKSGLGIDDDMVELYRWCRGLGVADEELSWASSGGNDSGSGSGNDDGNGNDNGSESGSGSCSGSGSGSGNGDGEAEPFASPPLRRFDLGGIGSPSPGRTVGLARLVSGVLGVTLPKSKKLARSHWSGAPLAIPEVDYAARDAWAAAAVLDLLARLDPDRFSPDSLRERLDTHEPSLRSIADVSDRAVHRRAAKQEWKTLKASWYNEDGEDVRTDSERERYGVLTQELRDLAPMPPIPYEIEASLGLTIPSS